MAYVSDSSPRAAPPVRTEAERNDLAARNAGLVYYVVDGLLRRARRHHDETLRDDLAGAGWLGLLRAAELYDPARGKFSTMAVYWIRQAVLRELPKFDYVHVPAYIRGPEREALRRALAPLSLTQAAGRRAAEDGDFDPPVPPDPDRLAQQDERAEIRRVVASLPRREREVIELRYLANEPMTLREVGRRWRTSRQRVQQVEVRALARLRERLRDAAGVA